MCNVNNAKKRRFQGPFLKPLVPCFSDDGNLACRTEITINISLVSYGEGQFLELWYKNSMQHYVENTQPQYKSVCYRMLE